jgi:hypothetical protein
MATNVTSSASQVPPLTVGPTASLPRPVAVSLLALGPALSVWFVAFHRFDWFTPQSFTVAMATVLLFWSPLPFSVPALVLQDARDAALPEQRWVDRLVRPFRLLGFLAVSPESSVRTEMVASLLGLVAGVGVMLAVLV